eukprot:TRINITY_DN18095_c0_g3_i2.p1 TRINITY_DN18095_c0_g3~~TRINITY_DN18095_c0_g3_i2.p1  ORF type:complete len:128 (-),score=7.69 TRINITY_DN18095_c0_g3_i2:31-414(-)
MYIEDNTDLIPPEYSLLLPMILLWLCQSPSGSRPVPNTVSGLRPAVYDLLPGSRLLYAIGRLFLRREAASIVRARQSDGARCGSPKHALAPNSCARELLLLHLVTLPREGNGGTQRAQHLRFLRPFP